MAMNPPPDAPAPADRERATLREANQALLRLHKTVLDVETLRFEREHGPVARKLDLLDLVVRHPAFAWLRPLTALIVAIDEALAADEPPAAPDVARLAAAARSLLTASEDGDDFQRAYHRALQEEPAVILAHGGVMRALAPALRPPDGAAGPAAGSSIAEEA